MNTRTFAAAAMAVILGGAALYTMRQTPATGDDPAPPQGAAMVEVAVPALSGTEPLGKTAFNAKCASCHGENAAGRNGIAPPLVHKYYEPGHHGDQAFHIAAQNGVRAHHWPFGDMPPVEGLTTSDVANIVAYVRALQRANGIE